MVGMFLGGFNFGSGGDVGFVRLPNRMCTWMCRRLPSGAGTGIDAVAPSPPAPGFQTNHVPKLKP